MGFPHPGTGQSMRRIRYKPGNIQSIIMLSFSLLSLAIMLVTVVVMYIKFADASQDSIIELWSAWKIYIFQHLMYRICLTMVP